MQDKRKPYDAEIVLGQQLERARKASGMTRRELARVIRDTEQQITKYETGGFVPLTKIEAIAEAVGEPVQKRVIRRISLLRKLEIEKGIEQHELSEIYTDLFSDEI